MFSSYFNKTIAKKAKFYKPLSFKFDRILSNGNFRFDYSETFFEIKDLLTGGTNMTFVNTIKDRILEINYES